MSRELNAVAQANKRLRAENMELWRRIEELSSGAEEQRILNELLVKQIVMLHKASDVPESYELSLPKPERKKLDGWKLEARSTDDGLFLRVVREEATACTD